MRIRISVKEGAVSYIDEAGNPTICKLRAQLITLLLFLYGSKNGTRTVTAIYKKIWTLDGVAKANVTQVKNAVCALNKALREASTPVVIESVASEYSYRIPNLDRPHPDAKGLAIRYANAQDYRGRDDVIDELYAACLQLHHNDRQRGAIDFALDFERSLACADSSTNETHQELLMILCLGLPVSPDHLPQFKLLDMSQAKELPHYLGLLHAARLMEFSYSRAREHLDTMRGTRDRWFAQCPGAFYMEGMTASKLLHLDDAKCYFESGLQLIRDASTCNSRKCTAGCSMRGLELELIRGLGAALRKSNSPAEALSVFAEAKALAEDDGIPRFDRSHFLFSWGYLELKVGLAPLLEGTGDVDRMRIESALGHFKCSAKLEIGWSAPVSRAGIAELALGLDAKPSLVDAYHRADLEPEDNPEAILTGLVAKAALMLYYPKACTGIEAGTVLRELETLLKGPKAVALSTRQCHHNDSLILRTLHASIGTVSVPEEVSEVFALLDAISDWDYSQKPQRAWMNEYEAPGGGR